MIEPDVLFPTKCPTCGREALNRLPVAVVAGALLSDAPLQLRSSCHGIEWIAAATEVEQIREYLFAGCIHAELDDTEASR